MPLLHITTPKPPTSALHPVPDDGKVHTIPLGLGLDEEHVLEVMIGDHRPQGLALSSPSSAAPAAATAGYKRRRRFSGLLASQSVGNEPPSLTIRYTAPTTRQDQKATRSVQQYHARTIREIETAFRNAKQARLELEAAPATTKTDLVAAALEIHLLTKELNRRLGINTLSFEQEKTHRWFLVRAGEPSRLLGVPGSPLVCLYSGDRVVYVTSLDKVVINQPSVPVVPYIPDPIEGKFVKEIVLTGRPSHMACHADKAYVTHVEGHKMSVLDVERGAVVEEWTIPGAEELTGVAVHGEHVFVADVSNNCIRVLDMEGKQERQFGTKGIGKRQFNNPDGVAIAGELLYVCDTYNHRLQVFTLDGTWVRSWGRAGDEMGEFSSPHGITVHDDEVYVSDSGNRRVQVFGLDGTFRRMWGSGSIGTSQAEIYYPSGVIVHGELVYVTDEENDLVQSFKAADGSFVGSWGAVGSAVGKLRWPRGLCVDDKDRLWVCDCYNSRLQVFR